VTDDGRRPGQVEFCPGRSYPADRSYHFPSRSRNWRASRGPSPASSCLKYTNASSHFCAAIRSRRRWGDRRDRHRPRTGPERCDACAAERLVAFSCKGRRVCPSCDARRMVEVAAHLTNHVLPPLPVHQCSPCRSGSAPSCPTTPALPAMCSASCARDVMGVLTTCLSSGQCAYYSTRCSSTREIVQYDIALAGNESPWRRHHYCRERSS
jgi:hypothetical protein